MKYVVPIVVVAEVEAVDGIDANHIVEKAVRDALWEQNIGRDSQLVLRLVKKGETNLQWFPSVRSIMHLSAALQHGEIRITANKSEG